ncbi:hypothetical protein HON36_06145 [Candidatus Parcubacteria bacterium]|jgi:hypothetical protein|nr:hypothetical protein [Candidatus Parcubacteria bacterium]MBT7228882.1 hypothetical protein [Candidatus Parcubacteria bacterium]
MKIDTNISQEELKRRSQEIAKLHAAWKKNLDNLSIKQDNIISRTVSDIQNRQELNKTKRRNFIKRLLSFLKK